MQNYRADDGTAYKNDDSTVRSVEDAYPTYSREIAATENGVEVSFGAVRDSWSLLTSGDSKFEVTRSIKPETSTINDDKKGFVANGLSRKWRRDHVIHGLHSRSKSPKSKRLSLEN